jgi:2-oxoglutarate/2-oxoacid ferredoxin oxidoreductase subunit alpha
MTQVTEVKHDVTIMFAGDSGDGIQLTGTQFTDTAALFGNDLSTFPNFPAEIRAPQGTLPGVSGFQLHFGSSFIHTPGDSLDVLVVMNAAALKANLKSLKPGGIIIANTDGFDIKNLKLAKYPETDNPLKNGSLEQYRVFEIDVTKLTRTALAGSGLGTKEIDRCKNMFVLGFIYWMFHRDLGHSQRFIEEKFRKREDLIKANITALQAGYNYGETTESIANRYEVKPAPMKSGEYRNIMGNQAAAIGLVAAAMQSGLELFYGSYPITPASDILHELSRHKNFPITTFQAEDEIAAICSAIGASFGGSLGVTASSGPGIALKTEAIGLAIMLELPLVILNIQRGGPSTGLPTKTEQADLLQAVYGRNGEAPLPVISARSASDCFDTVLEACRIAVEFMTPVIFLSDGYIANGSEPWQFPQQEQLPVFKPGFITKDDVEGKFLPYKRSEKMSRPWAVPGTSGLEHRIGGLEKEHETGNISYDPDNHEFMVKMRAQRIEHIANYIPLQELDSGDESGELLILGWGSTYGAIKSAAAELRSEGLSVAHAHLRYIHPFPNNLESLLHSYKKVLIPELNNGQLIKLIRDRFLIPAKGYSKIKGMPFNVEELKQQARLIINEA